MLGVAACVLAVVCKQMQQLQAMLGPAVHRGKGMTYKTLETMCNVCTNGRNMYHLTMLRVVGQESCVLLPGVLLGKKEGKNG